MVRVHKRSRLIAMPAVAGLAILMGVVTAIAGVPKRVVSLNLCADQLLIALAAPSQIAGLGPLAHKPQISFLAHRAKAFPLVRGGAEAIFRLRTDLVLLGSYDKPYVRQVLMRRKITYLELKPWPDIRSGLAQIRMVAGRLGQPQRGEALVDEIETALSGLQGLSTAQTSPTFLLVQRRGYVMQSGITMELLRLAGLHDLSPRLRLGRAAIASLEEIIRYRPDFLVVESLSGEPADQGQAKLLHVALRKLYPPARRLAIPDRLTVCAGPSTPDLIRQLAGEIALKVH